MTATFFFSQNVYFCFEFCVWVDGTWFSQYLTTFDVFTVNTTKQCTNVVACYCRVQSFTEHFKTSYNVLFSFFFQAYNFYCVTNVYLTTFNTASCYCTTTSDCENVFHRHQERFVSITNWCWDVGVYSCHQFVDFSYVLSIAFQSFQSGTYNDRYFVAREFVGRKKFTNFHFNQFDQFFVVNHVSFVQEYYDCRNANLASQQDVFASLRHRAVSCGTYQDSAVHLSCTSDHVFNIVSMAWAVNVCIVTVSCFVFNVCSVDCDTAFTFFWSFVDHAVILEVSLAFFSQYFCDCSSQSSFTMVNVTDCTDINMRFRTFKFFFSHFKLSSEENSNSINLM